MINAMIDTPPPHPALLPPGLSDMLPPEAAVEASAVADMLTVFARHGYQLVRSPMLEFEDGLLAGSGAAVADQTFRLMDPETNRMLGLRADITPQIGRIAGSRLANMPRPLRLAYAGGCLRMRGSEIAPQREVLQTGIELIGVDAATADAEMVLVGAEALAGIGLSRVSFDLTLPALLPVLMDSAGIIEPARGMLAHAIDRKDAAAVAAQKTSLSGMLLDLLRSAGAADTALQALSTAPLPPEAAGLASRLADTVALIRDAAPDLRLTIDPLECRSFRYHTGVSVTVYAPGQRQELARGGRYVTNHGEPATGLTLLPDAILEAAAVPPARSRVFVPAGCLGSASSLRDRGFITIAGLIPVQDDVHEATRLGCTHILRNGKATPLSAQSE